MISLQSATFEDIPAIRALADEIWRAVYPGLISEAQIDFMLNWMYSAEQLESEILNGDISYTLLMIDGEPVGYASITPGEAVGEQHLHKFYLRPTLHGRGLGSTALQQLLALAKADGAAEMTLRVNRANHRAIRCYERNGFIREREIDTDIGHGFVMDDYWMVRKLTES